MKIVLLSISFLCGLVSVSASAAPITYNFDFTNTAGSLSPNSGSFSFDPTSNQFTAFQVEWNGGTFNLTGSANDPSMDPGFPCDTGSNRVHFYNVLVNGCTAGVAAQWSGISQGAGGSSHNFAMGFSTVSGEASVTVYELGTPSSSSVSTAEIVFGSFKVVPSSPSSDIPEPNTVLLVPVGGAMLLALRRRRTIQGHPDQPKR